jgi:hypothetical protein
VADRGPMLSLRERVALTPIRLDGTAT